MVLEMQNYKYPSKDEWLEVSILFPEISEFGFEEISPMLIWERKKTIKEVHLVQNLVQWDLLFNKKIWNLRQSFVNAIVNYQRGIGIGSDKNRDQNRVIQRFQFEFYSEMTFYYLISTRDIILQIMNFAFELGIPESGKGAVSIWTVKNNLGKSDVFDLLGIFDKMSEDLKEANDIRNSMAHSFSKLDSDRRSTMSTDERTYNSGTGHFIKHDKQVEIIKESLEGLSAFFYSVKEKLTQKGYFLKSEE